MKQLIVLNSKFILIKNKLKDGTYMTKIELDGKQDGCDIKLIVREDTIRGVKQWMAKPKKDKIDTPHFIVKSGLVAVHEDREDTKELRYMGNFHSAGSMFVPSGGTFIPSEGRDIAILPMESGCDGFAVEFSESGAGIKMPNEGHVIYALGTWGTWQKKKN